MLQACFYAFAAAFAFIGIIAVAYLIMIKLVGMNEKGFFMVVIAAGTDSAEITSVIYSAYMRMLLFGDCTNGKVVAIDCGMDRDCRRVCEKLCRECGNIYIIKPDEVESFIINRGK